MATHIYHYNTHAEKRFFLGPEHHELYDMIALNGNIVSHTTAGIAGFIATAGKDFYINPQTCAFQHATIHLKRDVSDKKIGEKPRYEFKPSIIKLATERLGGAFSDVISLDRPIKPAVFLNNDGHIRDEAIDAVCNKVGEFQLRTMIDELDEEAREFIGDYSNLQPKFLIAPYFYLSPHNWLEWLKINIACYQRTKSIFRELPIYLCLVVSKEVLHNHDVIIDEISKVKPDGILLWIDELIEETLLESEIKKYIQFLQGLKQNTETIYNSHGGYLSNLLCHTQIGPLLNGVGHAMNYGEHRPIIPIGGGIPMARFYLYSIHSRLRFGDAAGIITAKGWLDSTTKYRKNVCKCHQCKELIEEKGSVELAFDGYGQSNPVTIARRSGTIVALEYPTREARQAAIRHYLYNKAKEFDDIHHKNFNELVGYLKNTYDEITLDLSEDYVSHLLTWHKVLSDIPITS